MEPHLAGSGPAALDGSAATDYGSGIPNPSPLAQSTQQQQHQGGRFNEEFDASRPQSAVMLEGDHTVAGSSSAGMRRSDSVMSQSQTLTPSRGGTLKKKNSLKKSNSLRRSGSRRSLGAGSVQSLILGDKEKYEGADLYSAFFTPVPTRGNPTEILANRFQDWRRVLKDLISYFREVQKTHEARSKQLLSLSNIVSNISGPSGFLREGGIGEATTILKQYHRQALAESNKAKNIEEDIMVQLTGLRSDLAQKIKEIKNLSGDFKNSVDKETDTTRKAVRSLQEALGLVDTDPAATSGKGDPYIVKLGVEKQIDRQIDEENYLHKAFLNLENSGRELESIVVGEIQKAYNAYAGILKREADEAYEAVEKLRTQPIAMAKDREWDAFVLDNENFVDPRMPVRSPDQITYPGKDAPAAAEVRSGMLERKSKYLKSYTPGWYVLSPTHLHEFKSADRLNMQAPVMSLYLHEQKLGSHSSPDSSSHKFMLKGRQTGGMHRGHGWVFRAESRDTMLAWFNDIKNLTEKTGVERDAFVRKHARSISGGSMTARSVSSDGGMEEDEADQVPYSAAPSQTEHPIQEIAPDRPQPGGRFPSDLNVHRNLQMPLSPSSGTSSNSHDAIAAAGSLPGSGVPFGPSGHVVQEGEHGSLPRSGYVETDMAALQILDQQGQTPQTPRQQLVDSMVHQRDRAATIDKAATAVAALAATAEPASKVISQNSASHETESQDYASYSPYPTQNPTQDPAFSPSSNRAIAATLTAQPVSPLSPTFTQNQADGPAELGTLPSPPITADHQIDPGLGSATPIAPPLAIPPHPGPSLDQQRISGAATPATMTTQLSDSPPGSPTMTPFGGSAVKPPQAPARRSETSVYTVSDLHVPGEYPRQAR